MTIDFGLTAQDYAKHRAGFPDSFYEYLLAHGIGRPGQRVLDVGTGTGTLARGFAARGCRVSGLDPATAMLAQANALCRSERVSPAFIAARAERMPVASATFDVVSAGQCWHWFDRPVAAAEAKRFLWSGGSVVIAHFDRIPLQGNVVELTEKLIMAHNPKWIMGGMNGIHPHELTDLGQAGFENIRAFSYDIFPEYSHDAWRGRIRASAGVGASLAAAQVAIFDSDLAALLHDRFPDPMPVHHRIWAVIATQLRVGGFSS